jgi:hypothetical protein
LLGREILIRSAAVLLFATSLLGPRKACVQMIPSSCFDFLTFICCEYLISVLFLLSFFAVTAMQFFRIFYLLFEAQQIRSISCLTAMLSVWSHAWSVHDLILNC